MVFLWVPAHVGGQWNEEGDKIALYQSHTRELCRVTAEKIHKSLGQLSVLPVIPICDEVDDCRVVGELLKEAVREVCSVDGGARTVP